MTKRKDWIVLILFMVFLLTFFLLNLILPDKAFSEQENRYLQLCPTLSFRSLFSGTFTSDFETYCSDQFVGRDQWISLKARMELLQGKGENNGIYLCEGERLIEAFQAPKTSDLDRRIQAVDLLTENAGVPVSLALIPTASEVYGELLPHGAPNDSEADVIRYVSAHTKAVTADLLSPLKEHKTEGVFYRTDHHWTSLGAFYGYQGLSDALGYTSNGLDSYMPQTVSDSFCGTSYSSSGFFWVKPDPIEIFAPEPDSGVVIERYENGIAAASSLYHEEMLDTKDKYRFFLGGNCPRVVIRTDRSDLPALLLIRDSYSDSLSPFLLDHFSEIHLLDLRYYRSSVLSYITEQEIDQVLVLYSVSNFCSDTNLALMTR